MDLRETKAGHDRRHPWELCRLAAVKQILAQYVPSNRHLTILDVGCGDGFVSRELRKTGPLCSITCVDTGLSGRQIAELSSQWAEITFYNDYERILEKRYDLVLMLDVLEHVENDKDFVSKIVSRYMSPDGFGLVTVPAFPSLFGSHDRFLKHYRRYSREQLLRVLEASDLDCLMSGYLFCSLLPIRFAVVWLDKIFRKEKEVEGGVGTWRRGRTITGICERILGLDNRLTLYLAAKRLILPGLSTWAICRKRRS